MSNSSGGRMSDYVEHDCWMAMKSRCLNQKAHAYERYGGRGITVCERWRVSFYDFLADMGPRPSPRHSLDRYPNNNGNYEPGNVRWATRKQQASNRSNAKLIEFNGVTDSMSGWARSLGMSPNLLSLRLRKWPLERAMTAPVRANRALTPSERDLTKYTIQEYDQTARYLRILLAAVHEDAGEHHTEHGLKESTQQAIYKLLNTQRREKYGDTDAGTTNPEWPGRIGA